MLGVHLIRRFKPFAFLGVFLLCSGALVFPDGVQSQWEDGLQGVAFTGLPAGTLYDILRTAANWLLGTLGFLATISFVWAGLLFLVSGGSEARIGRAKRALLYAIVGVLVSLMGLVVLRAADSFLRGRFP
jgi:hypothetical protein